MPQSILAMPCDKIEIENILRSISKNLENLSTYTKEVELKVGDLVDNSTIVPDDTLASLQLLDIIRQSLEDLSVLSNAIGQHPHISTCELLEILKLDITRQMVLGCPVQNLDTPSQKLNSVDLF